MQMAPVGEDEEKTVSLYIKINIIERSIDDYVIVVSFHEAEREMTYLFR
jgi:hypothetical protein